MAKQLSVAIGTSMGAYGSLIYKQKYKVIIEPKLLTTFSPEVVNEHQLSVLPILEKPNLLHMFTNVTSR